MRTARPPAAVISRAVADEATRFDRKPELPALPEDVGVTSPVALLLRYAEPKFEPFPTVAERLPIFAPLPAIAGGWRCVAADPPVGFMTWSEKGQSRSPSRHYGTLTPATITTLPLQTVVADDCWLMLWWPDPHLPTMVDVMRSWGFTFSGRAFSWIKTLPSLAQDPRLVSTDAIESMLAVGGGLTTRKNSESCWLGRRGKPTKLSRGVREIIIAPRRQHSRKPDEFYRRAETFCPGPRLDLFGRQSREAWVVYGNEASKFDRESERPAFLRRAVR
jgi:N6-adenosine-specific RNA methylase IME4